MLAFGFPVVSSRSEEKLRSKSSGGPNEPPNWPFGLNPDLQQSILASFLTYDDGWSLASRHLPAPTEIENI